MALSIDQLKQKVASGDSARQELFNYLHTNACLPAGLNQAQQEIYFNGHINRATPQAEAWLYSFLPHYNGMHKGVWSNIPLPIGDRGKFALGVGAATAGTGLAALVASAFVGNEAGKGFLHATSSTLLWMSPINTILAYASSFVNDTGKKRMKDVGIAAGISILALVGKDAINHQAVNATLEAVGYTGLAASSAGLLFNMVKYHK